MPLTSLNWRMVAPAPQAVSENTFCPFKTHCHTWPAGSAGRTADWVAAATAGVADIVAETGAVGAMGVVAGVFVVAGVAKEAVTLELLGGAGGTMAATTFTG